MKEKELLSQYSNEDSFEKLRKEDSQANKDKLHRNHKRAPKKEMKSVRNFENGVCD